MIKVTDSSATTKISYEYDVLGEISSVTNPDGITNPFTFRGGTQGIYDIELGLHPSSFAYIFASKQLPSDETTFTRGVLPMALVILIAKKTSKYTDCVNGLLYSHRVQSSYRVQSNPQRLPIVRHKADLSREHKKTQDTAKKTKNITVKINNHCMEDS